MKRRDLVPHERELGFVPRDCVRWLDPPELARTAARVIVAKLFADFGDKRELQEVFDGRLVHLARPPEGDLWIDYTADLGDGFDATYTIASLLAQDALTPERAVRGEEAGGELRLPRGHLLILGGDEVYPTASARDYEDRTIGPFSAAFPAAEGPPGTGPEPSLLALPGNHDWYDGLTSFLRVFTRGRRIGAWRSIQTRSYFALNPVPGWWILGLDSQLGEYIDEPQLDYFKKNVTDKLEPGDGVIICTAQPAWVHTKTDGPDGFNQLHYFDKNFIRARPDPATGGQVPTGARVRLWVTGDTHHYSRYAEVRPTGDPTDPRSSQFITCGLGGAFLSSTHRLPDELTLPPAESRMRSKDVPGTPCVKAAASYPDSEDSRRMARVIANPLSPRWAGWRNPRFLWTAGVVHVVLFLLSSWLLGAVSGESGRAVILAADLTEVLWFTGLVAGIAVVVVLAGAAWSAARGRSTGPPTGAGLTAFQVVAACLVLLAIAAIPWPGSWPDWVLAVSFVLLALSGGALIGTEAFALFTLTKSGGHPAMWQMSGQAIDDYKGFLRLRLRASGDLEVYPLVVDRVCRDWDLVPIRPGLVRPVPARGLPTVRLLEEPIVISREGFS